MAAKTKWNFETEYIQSCNCDYGCPCNFNGLPTYGNCEALVGYRITKGTFGGTKLDGATFAMGLWWPKAIHEGGGAARIYMDPKASSAQKEAIEAIASGEHGGGVWEIFAKTFVKVFPTKRANVDWRFKGHDSSFTVDGVGEVRSGHILNPVTNDELEGQVLLPGGINWKKAEVTSVDWTLRDTEAQWDMRHEKAAGFITTIKFNEKGPV